MVFVAKVLCAFFEVESHESWSPITDVYLHFYHLLLEFLREDFHLKNRFENLTFCKKGYNSLSANVMMLPITWFQGGNDIFLLSLMGHSVKCNYVVTGMVYSNLVSRNIKGGPQRAYFGKEWKNATNFLLPSWLVRVPNEPKPPYFVEVWRQMCPSPTRRLPTYYTTKYLIFKSNMI